MARTSRRALLSAGATAALAGIAVAASVPPATAALATVPVTHPDAKLITLCNRFIDLEQQKLASFECQPKTITWEEERVVEEAERAPLVAAQERVVERLMELDTKTLDGFRARARALVIYDEQGWKDEEISHGPFPGGMNFAIVRDLFGESI
ncbi:MAG: hypothetical protein ACRYG8_05985 [Janthinobacterium lividum]